MWSPSLEEVWDRRRIPIAIATQLASLGSLLRVSAPAIHNARPPLFERTWTAALPRLVISAACSLTNALGALLMERDVSSADFAPKNVAPPNWEPRSFYYYNIPPFPLLLGFQNNICSPAGMLTQNGEFDNSGNNVLRF